MGNELIKLRCTVRNRKTICTYASIAFIVNDDEVTVIMSSRNLIVLEKAINSWTFGNILLGGLIGWGVDLGTNAVSKPAERYFYVFAKDAQGIPAQ